MDEQQNVMREMPRYSCHKEVHALKIKEIVPIAGGGAIITPVDEGFAMFNVDTDFISKHNPHVDGYYVVYQDGYKSFSPKEAFENGYKRI